MRMRLPPSRKESPSRLVKPRSPRQDFTCRVPLKWNAFWIGCPRVTALHKESDRGCLFGNPAQKKARNTLNEESHRMQATDSHWYKDAIFYEVYVRGFYDSDQDGNGDLRGLIEKLDYVKDLGVDCLWLMPIFASPLKDDGYDIADFRAIHPSIGTVQDFEDLTEAAHARGIRVITDLVLNHTSDQHPWFQESRRSPTSPRRQYYVWSDSDLKYPKTRIIFKDVEQSNWSWDSVARLYYWHRFYSHQP